MNHPAYAQMVEAAEGLGLPQSYKNDLYVHDLSSLERLTPPRFGWILYRMGTHFLVDPGGSDRPDSAVAFIEAALRQLVAGSMPDAHFFSYEEGVLTKCETIMDFVNGFSKGPAHSIFVWTLPCPHCKHLVPVDIKLRRHVCPDCHKESVRTGIGLQRHSGHWDDYSYSQRFEVEQF